MNRASIAATILFITVVCLLVNIIHLVWTYVNPEGFWSFQVFIDTLRTVFFGIAFVFFALLALFMVGRSIFHYARSFRRKDSVKSEYLQEALIAVVSIILCVFDYGWNIGWQLKLDTALADKYSYIKQSDKLLNAGRYSEALTEAAAAYQKASTANTPPNRFFLLSRFYYASDHAQAQRLNSTYEATIGYAYCLDKTSKSAQAAANLYAAALKLSESVGLREAPEYKIFPLAELATLSLSQGQYAQAEQYFDSLLPYTRLVKGEDADYAINALSIFAGRAFQTGQFAKASKLLNYSVTLYEQNDDTPTSSNYVALLLGASMAELNLGHLTLAGDYLAKAQPIAKKKKAKQVYLDFLRVKSLYCSQAAQVGGGKEELLDFSFFQRMQRLLTSKSVQPMDFGTEAEQCLQELVGESSDRNGDTSVDYAQNVAALAQFYTKQRKFTQAQALNRQALKVLEPIKDSNQDLYYPMLFQATVADYYADKRKDLSPAIRQIEQYYFKALAGQFVLFTEQEREQYVHRVANVTNILNSLRIQQGTSKYAEELYNSILRTKSVALFSNQYVRKFVANADSATRKAYYSVLQDKATLSRSKITNNLPQEVDAEGSLKLRETAILRKLAGNARFQPYSPGAVQWTDVRAALSADEAAIEILAVPTQPYTKDSITYYALLTRREYAQPKLIRLFEESQLTHLLNQPGATKDRVNAIYQTRQDSLYQLIWAPFAKEVTNCRKLYLSVSGTLHTISFAALLPASSPEVVLLSSTRQLAAPQATSSVTKSAALFGAINYNYKAPSQTAKSADTRGMSAAVNGLSKRFLPLPYTESEVTAIGKILQRSSWSKSTLFQDSSASEVAFRKAVSDGFSYIHVATHGFFLAQESAASGTRSPLSITSTKGQELSSCGLALAGANYATETPSPHDGILTAEELAQLDMSHVELIVLSACETALGTIKGSEGVYGLQRALKMAGVKSSLVSLWKVPDKQTAELMASFYTNCALNMPRNRALQLAQLSIKAKYPQPFYWAGFQLISE